MLLMLLTHMDEISFKELRARHLGLEDYALVRNESSLEVIGMPTHISSTIMEVIFRTKGVGKIILVTDSLSMSGLQFEKYRIGIMTLDFNEDNPYVAPFTDGGLAEDMIKLIKAIENFYKNTSAYFNQAIQMATCNTLRSLGLLNNKRTIEIKKDTDLVISGKYFELEKVFIDRGIVFES